MAAPVRAIRGAAILLRTGILAGIVVSALLLPIAAVAGLGVREGAKKVAADLGMLDIAPLSQVTKVYASDGKSLITQFYEEYRIPTTIDAMSPHIQNAIIAAEDNRFYEHNGVDMRGIARAFVANQQAGGVSQGASTITMQYVRMSLRDSARTPEEVFDATERTPTRKLREIRLSIDLEKHLSKTEILERYLNAAYFGHRAFGVHAAAEVYFSKKPADLTPAEAAMLAGLVQAPSAYDPAKETQAQAAQNRRDYVLHRMMTLGYLSAAEGEAALAEPLRLNLHEPPNDCGDVPRDTRHWGYFCDLFKTWWVNHSDTGGDPVERLDALRRGGYTIVTTLDPGFQWVAQREVLAHQPTGSPFALGTVTVEPGTGKIFTMAVNREYTLDQSHNGRHSDPARARTGQVGTYPATVNPLLGGGWLPGYQAGSTFKMFTMLAALEKGMPLHTEINSPQRYQSKFKVESDSPARCGLYWCPANASGKMSGRHTMWGGFGKSVNTYFVQLEEQVGAEAAVRMAERLGLTWHTDIDKQQAAPERAGSWGAFTLGVADTTPLEMALAYATVAAEGMYCEPLPVETIALPGAEPVRVEPTCRRAVSEDVARGALDAARCVTGYRAAGGDCGGWSTAPGVYKQVGRPIAGKTGTTDDNRALWFIGMAPGLASASFIADPDNPFHEVAVGDRTKPRDAVAATMRELLAPRPVRDFVPPSPAIIGKPSRPARTYQGVPSGPRVRNAPPVRPRSVPPVRVLPPD
ncbi:penicillin-binding protein [Virgisporangium aliadipatigenens]|uniref:Penicillin-binding protein n=1 Tax=Virgisporangium aliadipatigenens TaxID=741659 RepID=A0A8J3YYN2_9ACTN|nr:transglycosylase domain-containing protein [Virgisporangium aliadipatigenens]GIJ52170.1 penicillin-binding protein [Virgisporangium aliadipatigenens]